MRCSLVLLISLLVSIPARAQEEVTLMPVKDNTLYEDPNGSLSNGAGEHLFAGKTAVNRIRRALLAFDVAEALPDGAIIEEITLRLNASNVPPGAAPQTFHLHRVTTDWGEGTSKALGAQGSGTAATTDDATWIHAFYDQEFWSEPGGDFVAEPSASTEVSDVGSYAWESTDDLVADVQAWYDDPDGNFGWILIGDESSTMTARRFDSREHPEEANRPTLTIQYVVGHISIGNDPLPASFVLSSPYPNPFDRSTMISMTLDAPQHVRVDLYDALGRSVKVLLEASKPAGIHHIEISTDGLPSGTYFYCAAGDGSRECRPLVVTR